MSRDGLKIVTEDIKGVLVREGAERASGPCVAVVEGNELGWAIAERRQYDCVLENRGKIRSNC